MAVDPEGRAYVTGWTDATDLPVTSDAFQAAPHPEAFTTAYLTVFQPGGQSLFYSQAGRDVPVTPVGLDALALLS